MTRRWRGPGIVTRVAITALSSGGAPLRRLCAELRDEQPVTIDVPPGTRLVMLQSTEDDPRVRVELSQHRSSRTSLPRSARPSWREDSTDVMWWRWWIAVRAGRRAAARRRERGGR